MYLVKRYVWAVINLNAIIEKVMHKYLMSKGHICIFQHLAIQFLNWSAIHLTTYLEALTS